jgi:tubulin polyglutamylase TTLL4
MYSGDREDGDSGLNEDYCEEEEEEEDLLSDINEDLSINDSISWEESASFSDDRFEETIAFSPLPLPDVATKGLPSSLMIPPRSTYIGETGGMSPPLTRSLFPSYFPPTIHFPLPKENYEPFTHEVKRQLKWKPSTITPNVIKQLLNRIGFTYTNRSSEWIGYWGKHMKSEVFRSIQHHQKVNHLPGSFQLGRKDYLWRNMAKMQAYFGRKNFDFMPQTFILPREIKKLRQAWDEHDGHHRHKWIIKPVMIR